MARWATAWVVAVVLLGFAPAQVSGSAPSPSASRDPSGPLASHAAAPAPSIGELNLTPAYPQESDAAFAFDTSDNASLLYVSEGVRSTSSGLGSFTWSYADRSWHLLPAAGSPGLAGGFQLADDPHDGYDLLFGGTAPNGTTVNVTWAFHDGLWTELHPTSSPPSNGAAPLMTYDPALGAVVLVIGNNLHRNQTWEFTGGNWTEELIHAPADFPPERAMAYDAADGYLVAYGGFPVHNSSTGAPQVINNTTWEFAHGRWTEIATAGPLPGLLDFQLAFDPPLDRLVLFGGSFANGTPDPFAWTYHAGNWTQLAGYDSPGLPGAALLAGDAADGELLAYTPPGRPLAPGASAATDLWALNGTRWAPAANASIFPTARCCQSLAYDPADGYLVAFGGFGANPDGSGNLTYHDTWAYADGNWTNLTTAAAPPPSYGGQMVYDAGDGYVLLYGGFVGSHRGETWGYRGGAWTRTGLSGSPPSTSQGCLAYDALDGYALYFGGTNGSTVFNETWSFHAGTWTELAPHGSPPPLDGCSLTYDSTDRYVVLWGGSGSSGTTNRTWTFAGGNWTELPAGPGPSPRVVPFFTDDPALGGVLLYGGAVGSHASDSDLWLFAHGTWYPVEQGSSAGLQAAGAAAYDPPERGVALLTGRSTSDLSQLWTVGGALPFTASPPVISPSSIDLGERVAFASGAYGGSGTYTYVWQGLPGGCPAVNLSAFSCLPNATGAFAVNVTVTDSEGHRYASPAANLTVVGDPSLTALSISPGATDVNRSVNLSANASGGAPPYAYGWAGLPDGCVSVDEPNLTCDPASSGTFNVTLEVTDARGLSANATATLAVDGPLSLTGLFANRTRLDVGQELRLNATAAGGTGELTFLWSGLPSGCGSANRSLLDCTPNASGTFSVELTARDAVGGLAQAGPLAISVNGSLNVTPVLPSRTALDVGQVVNLTAEPSGGTAPYRYVWDGLPGGCAGTDGPNVTCRPNDTGRYTIQVEVTDAVNASTLGPSVELQVTADPTVSAVYLQPPSLDLDQGTQIAVVAYVDNGSATLTWSGLPNGCSPPSGSATSFLCEPTESGNFSIAVELTDARNDSVDSGPSELTVTGDPTLGALQLGPAGIDLGQATEVSVTATAPSGYRLTWSGLPPGCAAPGPTATSFGCRPSGSGTYPISVELTDGHGVTRSVGPVSLLVAPKLVLGPLALSVAAPQVNATFEVDLPVTGGSGDLSVSWSGLPTGCTTLEGGWNQSCRVASSGTFLIGAMAVDRFGANASAAPFELTVAPNASRTSGNTTPPPIRSVAGNSPRPLPDVVYLGGLVAVAGAIGLASTVVPRLRRERSP